MANRKNTISERNRYRHAIERKEEYMVVQTQANSWWCPTIVNSSNEWLNSHQSGYPIPGAPPPMLRIVKRVSLEDTL